MTQIPVYRAAGLGLLLAFAGPALRAHAAEAPSTSIETSHDTKAQGLSKGQGEEGVKPGAGPMTGSKSDTSPTSGSAPATNAPSAPSGH